MFTAVQLNAQINTNNAIFVLATGLDADKFPIDNISQIQIGKDHNLYMYLTSNNDSYFQADSIHFKVSQYNKVLNKYYDEYTYSVNVDFDWSWCYKAIYFNLAGTFKIDVYADKRFLASTMITSIDDLIG